MRKVSTKEVFNLENAIAPETFAVKDDEILYFDRINRYEGRFCRLNKGGAHLTAEVDDSQGVLDHEGEEYLISINDNSTRIERLSEHGEWQEIVNFAGVYFDLKKNETENYACLGNSDSVTMIKIFNSTGRVLSDIRLDNIIFGSSICLHSEYIYLGAVDYSNNFKLIKMNYLGNIEASWEIGVSSKNRIISKICIYYNYIFILIDGRVKSLVILDRVDGSFKEILYNNFGLDSVTDFDIYGDNIFILSGRNIYSIGCMDIICLEGSTAFLKLMPSLSYFCYKYNMFSQGLRDQIKYSLLAAFFPTAIIYYFLSSKLFQDTNTLNVLRVMGYFYIIVSYFIASIKNISTMVEKEKRIEYLLCSSSEANASRRLEVPLFLGLATQAIVEFGMYPEFDTTVSVLVMLLTASVFYGIDYLCRTNIKAMSRDMVVELLEDEDTQTLDYIRKVVKNLRKGNDEKFYIEIISNKKITEKSLDGWKNSRNHILGQNIIVRLDENRITAEMDLSKRDIKYSRFSIIMDYVCYIKTIADIKEIQVEYNNKQT